MNRIVELERAVKRISWCLVVASIGSAITSVVAVENGARIERLESAIKVRKP